MRGEIIDISVWLADVELFEEHLHLSRDAVLIEPVPNLVIPRN